MQSNYRRLGDYIREVNIRNRGLVDYPLLGVSIQKVLMPSIANIIGTDMSTYKLIKKNQFAYGPVTSRNGDKISIALLEKHENALLSQAYTVFEVLDENELHPEYLMMWFRRPEFDRYARFMSHGSAREIFSWEEMCETLLPIPSLEKQLEVIKEYNVIQNRIRHNNDLIAKLEDMAQSVYQQMFDVDLDNLPNGWITGTLEDMSEIIKAGVIPKYANSGTHFVLGQRCVHDNYIDLHFARQHKSNEIATLLKFGDILINSTGSGTLGRVGQIYFEPHKLTYDSNMTLVRAAKDHFIEYLGCLLSKKESYFIQISQGSTSQTRLYCSMVNPVVVVIPDDSILIEFTNKIRKVRLYQQSFREEVVYLARLANLLLTKLTTMERLTNIEESLC